MRYALVILCLAVVLSGCSPEERPFSAVPEAHGELLYGDAIAERIPGDEVRVFGIGLGSTEEQVRSLHGAPDADEEYRFGSVRNLEYSFGQNDTVVLYHVERGVVTGILLTNRAAPLLANDTSLRLTRTGMYASLGVPTLTRGRTGERIYYYDSLGYEIFMRRSVLDRIYFTSPDRGLAPSGATGNKTLCAQVEVSASDPLTGTCQVFPTPCDVPEGWDFVQACQS